MLDSYAPIGAFVCAGAIAACGLDLEMYGMGVAIADYDNDGGNRNHWLSIRVSGTKSNRDGIGAVVRFQSASGKQWNMARSGSSYCSQSDLALLFGLGQDLHATIQIEWPSGKSQSIGNVEANQFLTVDEDRGIIAHSPR